MNPSPVVENQIWQKEELLPRPELQALQVARLRDLVARLSHVPFYAARFGELGVSADRIASMDDVRRLPFTTKSDLRAHYPLGFLAVPTDQIVRYHGSSGTTGKPTFVAYTRNDLEMWALICARFLVAGGIRPEHRVQVAFGYGLFTGGFGLHYGIERIGAAVIPAASGNTERQIMLLQDLRTDAIVCTPSYAVRLAEVLQEQHIPLSSLALKLGHFGAEPWTEDMRDHIERALHIRAFNNYGLSEVIGPGVSGDCAYRTGMHIQEDHFLVECIDPDTLEAVPEGQPGELVFTTLTKEAFPLIRYRTRDIATLMRSPCPCGRTGVRMSRVSGRTDDMLIVRGVNVFPSQIEEALLRVEGTAPHYLIEVDRPGAMDEMTVRVEVRPQDFTDSIPRMEALKDKIGRAVHAVTGLQVKVDLVEPQTIERFQGKAKRVIDRRKL